MLCTLPAVSLSSQCWALQSLLCQFRTSIMPRHTDSDETPSANPPSQPHTPASSSESSAHTSNIGVAPTVPSHREALNQPSIRTRPYVDISATVKSSWQRIKRIRGGDPPNDLTPVGLPLESGGWTHVHPPLAAAAAATTSSIHGGQDPAVFAEPQEVSTSLHSRERGVILKVVHFSRRFPVFAFVTKHLSN